MKLKGIKTKRLFRKLTLLSIAAGLLTACVPSISQFNETAYRQAVQLKVQSLALIDKATEPYEKYSEEADRLLQELNIAWEYAKGRPNNELSTRQWEIMLDPERNLMGGFLARWKSEGSLSPVFVREFHGITADAFDTIIGLESGKVKAEDL